MRRCYDGAFICLQCLVSREWPFFWLFQGRLYKKNFVTSVTDILKTIPVEDFQRCIQKWEQLLHRCVAAQENYFEGDNIDVWIKNKNFGNKKSVSLLFCHIISHVALGFRKRTYKTMLQLTTKFSVICTFISVYYVCLLTTRSWVWFPKMSPWKFFQSCVGFESCY